MIASTDFNDINHNMIVRCSIENQILAMVEFYIYWSSVLILNE